MVSLFKSLFVVSVLPVDRCLSFLSLKYFHLGLLEAMEQQQVSIAKAGVVASLPARCSVIAAANPKHGSYDMSRTVAENLNMAKPILSRFDLVFILRDRADKVHDRLVSSNIMNLYRPASSMASERSYPVGNADKNSNGLFGNGGGDSSASIFAPPTGNEMRMPLSERLAWVADIQKNPLPADLVRDYIAYAREYCNPQMTQEAGIVLKEYYMELRYVFSFKMKVSLSYVFATLTTDILIALLWAATHRTASENETQCQSRPDN